jgi:CHAD domain-containing protein
MTGSAEAKENVHSELSHAISEQVARAQSALRGELCGEEGLASCVHEARRAIKRARALLKLADPGPGNSPTDCKLRDASRALATLRDATVLVLTAEQIRDGSPSHDSEVVPPGMLEALAEEMGRFFDESNSAGGPLSEADSLLRLVAEELEELLTSGPGGGSPPAVSDVAELLRLGLGASYASARMRSDPPAGVGPLDERFHKLRKRVKDLRYQLEFLETNRPKIGHLVRDLHHLTDLLGDANDLTMLATHAASTDALSEVERVTLMAHLEGAKRGLRSEAEALSARLFEEEEDSFVRRVESCVIVQG